MIKTADHIIDLGPLGGDRGGELIATGTPEEIAGVAHSYTGQYLRPILEAAGKIAPSAPVAEPRPAAKRTRRTVIAAEPTVVPAMNGGKPPRAREKVAAGVAAPSADGKGPPATQLSPELAAARAAGTIGTRIARESVPQEPRPQTKAAAKRARQLAHPRKETDSERNLRERREQTK